MKYFNLTIENAIWRFYLMMAVVIVPFFLGVPIFALLALPIFLSVMLGITFNTKVERRVESFKPHVYTEAKNKWLVDALLTE